MSVSLQGLSVFFGDTHVVREVTLGVEPGGWLGIIGPNGAGKSTILRAIAGLVQSTGSIVLSGNPLPTRRREVARLVAYVPQRPELPVDMTVSDYVLLGRTAHLSLLGGETEVDRLIATNVLERLALTHFATRRLSEISGGEAQRAVLARALVQQASILLLDEPTTGLDLGHQQHVLELVDELRRERSLTVVCAMHDLVLAGQFAEELALVVAGSVIARGTPGEVLTESLLATHFAARVRRYEDDAGRVALVPLRDAPTRTGSAAEIEVCRDGLGTQPETLG